MRYHLPILVFLCAIASGALSPSLSMQSVRGSDPYLVQFDLPPIVAATSPDDPRLVSIELRLSSLIESPNVPSIKQWVVRCVPRDSVISIADYAPRTETGSDLSTPIQVKEIKEESSSTGISINGSYSHLTRANLVADRGKKSNNTIQFDRIAPVQAVTASGTIERGKGVYFKLRWTAKQVLEGEKTFHLTMRVPKEWRTGMMDVSVIAQAESNSMVPWERNFKTIGAAKFVVALYRFGDTEAESLARAVSNAEYKLRKLYIARQRSAEVNSLPSMLHMVATKLDLESSRSQSRRKEDRWVERLLLGDLVHNSDKQIRKLPMPIRVAALEYIDRRNEFTGINRELLPTVIAAKQPL